MNHNILTISEIVKDCPAASYNAEIVVIKTSESPFFLNHFDLPIHINAFSYLIVHSGQAYININDQDYLLTTDSFLQITPLHLAYFHDISDDFVGEFMTVSKNFVDQISALAVQVRIINGMQLIGSPVHTLCEQEKQTLTYCFKLLKKDIADAEHKFYVEKIRTSLERLYLEINNIVYVREDQIENSRASKVLHEFMNLLIDKYLTEHSVGYYAEALSLSAHHLTAIIKAQTGKTVRAFLDEMLFTQARNLLVDSTLTIEQIAFTLGFADGASFTKFFRRHACLSPRAFRRR